MTLTIELPEAAEARLEQEAKRAGLDVPQLAARYLLDRLNVDESTDQPRTPRPGLAADLFEGVDIDELLATPIPGLEEYMPE